jgi:hypothetical protein
LPAGAALLPRPPALRERFVTVDLSFLQQALAQAEADHTHPVRFELFDNVAIEAVTRSFELKDGVLSWTGWGRSSAGDDQDVVLSAGLSGSSGQVTNLIADFWSGTRRFHVQRVAGPVHSIVEIDQSRLSGAEGDNSPPGSSSSSYSEQSILPAVPGEAPTLEDVVDPVGRVHAEAVADTATSTCWRSTPRLRSRPSQR